MWAKEIRSFAPRILLYDDAVGAIAAPPIRAADPVRNPRRSILVFELLIDSPDTRISNSYPSVTPSTSCTFKHKLDGNSHRSHELRRTNSSQQSRLIKVPRDFRVVHPYAMRHTRLCCSFDNGPGKPVRSGGRLVNVGAVWHGCGLFPLSGTYSSADTYTPGKLSKISFSM